MEQEAKPKRQLTEAQRLAFMKGREKRLANLAKKREEKLSLKEEPIAPTPEAVVIPDIVPPPPKDPPVLVKTVEERQTPSKLELDDVTMDRLATLVADKVTVRPKQKRTYTRRPIPKEIEETKEEEVHTETETAYPVPQRTYFWM